MVFVFDQKKQLCVFFSYVLLSKDKFSAVPFRGPPKYNPKRRSGLGWAMGGGLGVGTIGPHSNMNRNSYAPPSPCPSEHMPYSSASSSLSEGSSGHRSHEDDISIVTGIRIFTIFYMYTNLFRKRHNDGC